MSNTVRFQFSKTMPDSKLHAINNLLRERVSSDGEYLIRTEEDNIKWLDDINTNPSSHQKHLKPKNRGLTMGEFKEMLSWLTVENSLDVEANVNRTKSSDAFIILSVLHDPENRAYIESISANGQDLIDLAGDRASDDWKERFKAFKEFIEVPEAPELTPASERREALTSGVALLNYWSPAPHDKVWVVFGNVDHPQFMKDDKYLDISYNGLYHDKEGRAYILIPLITMDHRASGQIETIYKGLLDIGVQVDFRVFAVTVYQSTLTDYKQVISDSKDYILSEEDCLAIMRWHCGRYAPSDLNMHITKGQVKYATFTGALGNKKLYNNINYVATTLLCHHDYTHEAIGAKQVEFTHAALKARRG